MTWAINFINEQVWFPFCLVKIDSFYNTSFLSILSYYITIQHAFNSSSFVLRIIIELVLHIKIILKRTLQVFTHHWHNFTTAHEIIEILQTSEFKTCCSYSKIILLYSNWNHELKPVILRFQYHSMKCRLNKLDNLQN